MRHDNWITPSHIHCKKCDCIKDDGCHIYINDGKGNSLLMVSKGGDDDCDCPYENATVE